MMIDQAVICAKLSPQKSRSAESLAIALGYDSRACRWLVPALHKLKDEGKVQWEFVNEAGNVRWRRA